MARSFSMQRFTAFPSRPVFGGSLQPGSTPGPVTNRSLTGDIGSVGVIGCNLITDARLRAACIAAAGLLTGGGSSGSGSGSFAFPELVNTCPDGYRRDSQGRCVVEGLGPFIPGDVGRADMVWQSVNGRYGAGYVPARDVREVRVCPPGAKLGKDGYCYDHLRKGDREHNPGTKPFLTGGEVNAIRRAKRLHKKFKRLSGGKNALFASSTKSCPPGRKKKK